jgi:hypothetical protein
MPNSSGGAVFSDANTLAGIHTADVWHLQGVSSGGGSSGYSVCSGSGRSSGSGSGCSVAAAVPSLIERNPKAMWTPPADAAAADAVEAAVGHTDEAAERSRVNIGHKTSMSLFTTAAALRQLLREAGLVGRDEVDAAAAVAVRRASHKRCKPVAD